MYKYLYRSFFCFTVLLLSLISNAQTLSSKICDDCYPDSVVALYADSLAIINKQLDVYPDSSELYTQRSFCFFVLRNFAKVKEDLVKALALDSTNCGVYSGFGYLYQMEQNSGMAILNYQKYLQYKPDDYCYNYYIGSILADSGEYQAAIPYFVKSIPDSNLTFFPYKSLGICYSHLGDNTNARSNYNTALSIIDSLLKQDTLLPSSYFWRAWIHTQVNDYRTVLADYDKCIQLESTNAENYFFRGIARKSLSQTVESCKDFDRALQLEYIQDAYDLLCENCKSLCRKYKKTHPQRQLQQSNGRWVH